MSVKKKYDGCKEVGKNVKNAETLMASYESAELFSL